MYQYRTIKQSVQMRQVYLYLNFKDEYKT